MAVRQLKDGRWICYFRADGKWKRVYFGRGPEARKAAERHDESLGLKPRRPRKEKPRVIFSELAQSYSENKNFNENSAKMLHYRLMANILPALGHLDATRIRDEDLDDYIKRRRAHKTKLKRPTKMSTIRRELHDIKAILNWAAKRRPPLIARNPVAAYTIPASDDEVIMPPTADETARILAAASPHMKRAIYLAYFLGLRPGAVELLTLTWKDVSWKTRTIRIQAAQKGGRAVRLVPMHKELYKEMKVWYGADLKTGPIIHYHGQPIKTLQTSWAGALERAKITRRLRPYDLRHHFVTRALEAGADMKALSEVVGSRPETLMKHYQHVTTKMHRETVEKIPSLVPQIRTKNRKTSTKQKSTQRTET